VREGEGGGYGYDTYGQFLMGRLVWSVAMMSWFSWALDLTCWILDALDEDITEWMSCLKMTVTSVA